MTNQFLVRATLGIAVLFFACTPVNALSPNNGTNTNPGLQWEYTSNGHLPQSLVRDQQNRPYLYVAQKTGGILILDITNATQPQQVSVLPKSQLATLDAMYIVQQGTNLYIALGDFFAAQGSKAGLAIVSVKDPHRPEVLSLWTSPTSQHGSAHIVVDGKYAYLGAMKEGIYIFDIGNERKVQLVSTITPDIHFPKPNPNSIQYPNARGAAIHDHLLFVANDAGGLRVLDVSNKNNPQEIGKYINSGMGNKAQAYNNVVLDWPYAYVAVDYCGLEILNVQDPQSIQQIGWWNPWTCHNWTNFWFNSSGHTNQVHLDGEQDLVLLSAGDSELQVVDVSDPQNPRLSLTYGKPNNKQGVWGLSVTEKSIYLAYIKTFIPFRGTWSGIKALSR